jgi:hypothetical protein
MGIPIDQIAAVEEIQPAYARMLIKGAKKNDGSPDMAADIAPPQPRRLSCRSAQYRA